MGSKTFRKQPVDAKKKTRRNRSNKTRRNLKNKGGANFRLRKEFYSKKRRGGAGILDWFSKPAHVSVLPVRNQAVYCDQNCSDVGKNTFTDTKDFPRALKAEEDCKRQKVAPICRNRRRNVSEAV